MTKRKSKPTDVPAGIPVEAPVHTITETDPAKKAAIARIGDALGRISGMGPDIWTINHSDHFHPLASDIARDLFEVFGVETIGCLISSIAIRGELFFPSKGLTGDWIMTRHCATNATWGFQDMRKDGAK